MALRRFYIEPEAFTAADSVQIDGDLFHHIREVCRFATGDQFEVLPGDGTACLVEIEQVGNRGLTAKVLSRREVTPLAKPYITLALSVPKLPKVDWIVEKSVELGAFAIRPFVSDFSFLRKASELSANRMQRWEKLVVSATQQCGRGETMRIHPAVTLEKLLEEFNQSVSTAGLFPYEGEANLGLAEALLDIKKKNLDHLWVFVGSEGGFSRPEVQLFANAGLNPVSLGEQILRVETACLALLSIIKYDFSK